MRAGEAAAAAASDLRETLEAWGVSSQSPFIGSKKSASLRLMVRAILSGCKRRKRERERVSACACACLLKGWENGWVVKMACTCTFSAALLLLCPDSRFLKR